MNSLADCTKDSDFIERAGRDLKEAARASRQVEQELTAIRADYFPNAGFVTVPNVSELEDRLDHLAGEMNRLRDSWGKWRESGAATKLTNMRDCLRGLLRAGMDACDAHPGGFGDYSSCANGRVYSQEICKDYEDSFDAIEEAQNTFGDLTQDANATHYESVNRSFDELVARSRQFGVLPPEASGAGRSARPPGHPVVGKHSR